MIIVMHTTRSVCFRRRKQTIFYEEVLPRESFQDTITNGTIRQFSFTKTQKDDILGAFDKATKTSWFQSNKSLIKAAKGVHSGNLTLMLDKAIEYTEKSKKYWGKCHKKRDELDNNKFVLDYQKKLKVKKYKQDRQLLVVDLEDLQNDIKESK